MTFLSPQPAVFLNRNATLVKDVRPIDETHQIRFVPGVLEALRLLHRIGFALIVMTGDERKAHYRRRPEPDDIAHIAHMERILRSTFAEASIPLQGFYHCSDHSNAAEPSNTVRCLCRKPKPGVLVRASKDLYIDMKSSWVVGDSLDDIEAGRWAGCRSVLIHGHETEWNLTESRWPDFIASTLLEAAQLIVLTNPSWVSTHSPNFG
jgi:HAD superfamily hydrolase (TIGR01662 family)